MKNRFYIPILAFLVMGLFTNDVFAQPASELGGNGVNGPLRANYVNGYSPSSPAQPNVITLQPSAEQLLYNAQFSGLKGAETERLKLKIRPEISMASAPLGPIAPMFPEISNPSTNVGLVTPEKGCESADQADSGNGGFIYIPPDPHGTVGTNHALVVNNVSIQGFAKDCTPSVDLPLQTLQSFFGAGNATFDPKARYDNFSNRYLVTTLEVNNAGTNPNAGNTSLIYVGVSPVGTIAGAWTTIAIDAKLQVGGAGTAEKWCDYPGFAVDEEAIYISCNYFDFTGAASAFFTREYVINKASLYAGTFNPATDLFVYDLATATGNPCNGTNMPAQILTNPGGTIGTWFTSYNSCSFGGPGGNEAFVVMQLNDPLLGAGASSSATFVQQDISDVGGAFGFPPLTDMPQSGSAVLIESNDPRILDAVYHNGELFFTSTILPNAASGAAVGDINETTAIFAELDMTAGVPATPTRVVLLGGDDLDPGTLTTFPSISVNNDLAVIGYAASSPNHFAGAYYSRFDRTTNTASGTLVMREGRDVYDLDFGGPRNRWGDYTAVALDPVDDSFWVFNEYAQETAFTGRWGQYIIQVDAAGAPAGPVNDDIASATYVDLTPFAATANTDGADSEAGELQPPCATSGNSSGNSVWFNYTPASSGNADFSVSGSGDYVLSVETGVAHPLTGLVCVDAGGQGFTESITALAVTGGTTYLVRVAEYGAAPSAAARDDASNAGHSASQLQAFGVNIDGPLPSPLPVELASFDAEVQGTDVMLRWTTASETNNAGFEIQRLALNGESFEILGFVDGNGTTVETMNYSFMIDGETPGVQVYRLKQVDFDGAVSFSENIESQVEVPNGIWLGAAYPNPFNPRTKFSVAVDETQQVKIEVFDYLGKSVAVLFEGSLSSGQAHEFRLDANNLTSGTYLYRVTGSKSASFTKSVVLMK